MHLRSGLISQGQLNQLSNDFINYYYWMQKHERRMAIMFVLAPVRKNLIRMETQIHFSAPAKPKQL